MADFVEREKIQEVISDIYKDADSAVEGACIEIWSRVKEIPAADVRSVVLCRDCQYSYELANMDGDSYRYCGDPRSRWNHDIDRMVYDDDYCKWGQKKEES